MLREDNVQNIKVVTSQRTKEREYWLSKLSGEWEKSNFPYDFNKAIEQETESRTITIQLPDQLVTRIREITKGSDIRLFISLLASVLALLNKYSYKGNQEIFVGTPIYKQEHEGELVNTFLILLNHIEDTLSFKDLLVQVGKHFMEAVENQNYPIESLLQELEFPVTDRPYPLVDLVVMLENIHSKKYIQHLKPSMIYSFQSDDKGISTEIEYNPLLYAEESIQRIHLNLESFLSQALFSPETPLKEVEFLTEKEKHILERELNHTGVDFPGDKTLNHLLEEQMGKSSESIALILDDKELTYGCLNTRAQQLSSYLSKKEIRPGALVGLLFERSLEKVITILGILKAGGVYLPIDPLYPQKRIQYMLDDSSASLLITHLEVLKTHSYTELKGLSLAVELPPVCALKRPQIQDFNSVPIPNRSLVNYEKYNQFIGLTPVKNSVSLQATRGCPYKCAYCHKIWPKSHIIRSAENIFAEVKMYYDLGVRNFAFIDDIFNLNRKNSTRFFELVLEHGLKCKFHFPAGLRGDILTKDFIDLMVKAGTISMGLALETASLRLQKLIGKNLNLDKLKENITYITETYPQVIVELFMMHGFPSETKEEARMTLDFLKSIKWVHFPYFHILKIYPNTDMSKLAIENGVAEEDILNSVSLAYHELPDTLPFEKEFTQKAQAEFANEYFLLKERLLDVLPHQMNAMTEDELVQKYDSYLPQDIHSLDDLLEIVDIERSELRVQEFKPESQTYVKGLNQKFIEVFDQPESDPDALRVLLLDLSQFFSKESDMLYDVVEPPLGLMYLMTYLDHQYGKKVKGKISKSRIDFDDYQELKELLEEFQPQVIGIRTLSYYKDFFHKTVGIIRNWGYEGIIMAGGPYGTSEYEAVLQDSSVNLVVLGEGEVTFSEVIGEIIEHKGNLPGEERLKGIPGLAFMRGKQEIQSKTSRAIGVMEALTQRFNQDNQQGIKSQKKSLNIPSDPAYIIYTSGTTGKPKGSVITHQNVVRLMKHDQNLFDFSSSDSWTLFHSYCFDFSVWEMYGALLFGGRLNVIPLDTARDPEAFLKVLKREKVTVLNQTPSAFYGLIQEELSQQNRELGLRYVIFGGEALSPAKLEQFQAAYPETKLINMYGITETTVHVTYKEITNYEIQNNISSIGKPIPTLGAYLMDRNQKPLPIGIEGELWVGGAGVCRGYLNRGHLNLEKFIPDPNNPGQRLYRSGDLVKVLPHGDMEYLGRIDDQVKIRGFRIELGEIENRILTHKKVKEAVVINLRDEENNHYLCAYYVAEEPVDTTSLKDYLALLLPEYMIPVFFVHLDQIPLTSNGKIDRKALPEPTAELGEEYRAPENPVEEALVQVWQGVLGIEKVGINDNFFMLGGDSIKTIQIVSRMKRVGYKVEMRDIFEFRTILELAPNVKLIEEISDQSVVTGVFNLTPIQKRFFLGGHTDAGNFVWPILMRSNERLEEKAVRAIFKKFQEHHDALRITFFEKEENGVIEMVQKNHGPDFPLCLEEYDLTEEEDPKEILKNKVMRIQTNMDLQKGPLFKLGLFHMADGDRLLIALHHLVVDGISWRIIFEDIETLYQQYKEGRKLELPLKTDSYKTWAERLYLYANQEPLLKERSFWTRIENTEVEEVQPDFEGEAFIKDREGASIALDEECTKLLLARANKAFGTEINDILITALSLSMKQVYGHSHVPIVMEGHGREDILKNVDLTRTIGWFTSEYPVMIDVTAESLGHQVKEVKETLRQIPHKGVGYGILKYLTRPENKQNITFKVSPQISFNYLGQFDEDVKQMSTFTVVNEVPEDGLTLNRKEEYYFNINGMISFNRLTLVLYYSKKLFKPERPRQLMSAFKRNLEDIIHLCAKQKEVELTPSDLTYKELTISGLETLSGEYDIQDVYPLTPMQEGMLFHSLEDPDSQAYLEQISYRLKGELNSKFVKKSLVELFQRHDILRTMFVHEGYQRPLQILLKQRKSDFIYKDIRKEPEAQKEIRIREIKTADKQNSFSLKQDVLMRVILVQITDNEYEIIWTHHHILMDGWCVGILISEFFTVYYSLLQGKDYVLPPVKPYSIYIKWIENQGKKEAEDYWGSYLMGYDEAAQLPRVSRINNKAEKDNFQLVKNFLILDPGKTNVLIEMAARNNVTLNILIQALWGILLGRHSHKEDVVFGIVVSGRPTEIEGVESMVGLFINTIPVRITFNEGTKLLDLIQQLNTDALESGNYHYYPLVEIQALSDMKQNLLDHLFAFENYPVAESIEKSVQTESKSESTTSVPSPTFQVSNVEAFEQSNYDLNIIVIPGNQMSIEFRYNSSAYEEGLIEQLKRALDLLVNQVMNNEQIAIGKMEIISHEEKKKIIETFNSTKIEYPEESTTPQLFEEQASRTPDQVALKGISHSNGEEITLTYQELDEVSNQLAYYLMTERINRTQGPGLVGLLADRKIEMIFGIIGILKTGSAYVPLDPKAPITRRQYILKECSINMLVTLKGFISEDDYTQERIFIDDNQRYQDLPRQKSGISITHKDTCYVIFTSGSTGNPKGVPITHGNLSPLLHWGYDKLGLGTKDRVVQNLSYYFDWSVWEIFITLTTGATLYTMTEDIQLNPNSFTDFMNQNAITTLHITPTQYSYLANSGAAIPTLEYLFLGAEKLTKDLLERSYEKLSPQCRVFNMYGPTEATIISAVLEINREPGAMAELKNLSSVPIGDPVANTTAYVMDLYGHLMPVGVPGELCVGGDGVARGYLNSGEITDNKYIPDPFQKNGRIYCTGDLVKWHTDGTVEFLGRIDQQVKIRGFRIELGEIENQLLTHDAVNEAVVIYRHQENEENYLCAYYVLSKPVEDSTLRDFLQKNLPDYMVPQYFVELEKMPLTKSGKTDKKALPSPEIKEGKGIRPRNPVEKTLAVLWSEILHLPEEAITIDCNFFELGGHSLKAVKLVSSIHKEFNVKIPLSEVFNNPFIREISHVILRSSTYEYIALQPTEKKEYYPLSFAQKSMYVLQQLDPNNTVYNVPGVEAFQGDLDVTKLGQAFRELICRHESLRTSFCFVEGKPVQRVKEDVDFSLEHCKAEENMADWVQGFVRPFDLSYPPLFRVGIVKKSPHQNLLILDLHHIVSDAVSLELMVRDLKALYDNQSMKSLRLQYKDYSEWQNNQEQQGIIQSQGDYWIEEFKQAPKTMNLPLDYQRPQVQGYKGHTTGFELDRTITQSLKKTAETSGITMFMMMMALLNILLSKLSAQEDVVIGTDVAGRNHPDLEEIMGIFINTLGIRNYPKAEMSFQEFLSQVKQNTLSAFENQDYPFEDLVNKVSGRDSSRNPLFDVMFAMQVVEHQPSTVQEILEDPDRYQNKTSKFDMIFSCIEAPERLVLLVEYNTDLFKAETIGRFIEYFKEITTKVLGKNDLKIRDITISSDLLEVTPHILEQEQGDFEF